MPSRVYTKTTQIVTVIENVRVVPRHDAILEGMHRLVCANLVEHANNDDAAVHGHFSLRGRETEQ